MSKATKPTLSVIVHKLCAMMHPKVEDLWQQAISEGVTVNGIVPHVFADRGLGLVASRDHNIGSLLVSVPTKSLKTAQTVAKELRQLIEGVSVQGLLAIDLILDESDDRCKWKSVLPSRSSFEQAFPFWWDQSLQKLLPEAAMKLLTGQQAKLSSDWSVVSRAFPSLSRANYAYYWFTVGTRTFYYTESASDCNKDPGECLALLPFADLFNHSSTGCEVTFSSEVYRFTATHKITAGEEVFINYGEHSNDFLLTEYGFMLENNEHDTIALDLVLLDLFNRNQREILKSHSFWAGYFINLDHTCHRAEVAIRLLCMPFNLWRQSLEERFDVDDEYREAVDEILQESLTKYCTIAHHMILKISRLSSHHSFQQAVLRRRWEQIEFIFGEAVSALHHKRTLTEDHH